MLGQASMASQLAGSVPVNALPDRFLPAGSRHSTHSMTFHARSEEAGKMMPNDCAQSSNHGSAQHAMHVHLTSNGKKEHQHQRQQPHKPSSPLSVAARDQLLGKLPCRRLSARDLQGGGIGSNAGQ